MDILSAKVAPIPIGSMEIEGLLFSDGSFGVAIPQLDRLKLVPPNRSLKQLESLLGMTLQSHRKVKTELNPKAVNAIDLLDFEKVLRRLDRQGNEVARSLCDDLIGVILHQLFCDGFKIVFKADDRQEFLKERMESKALFWELTEAIRDTRLAARKEIDRYHYSNPMNAINRGLFGKTAKEIRSELQIPDGALTRDSFGTKSLRRITVVQEASALRVRRGDEPCAAIATVIRELAYPVIDFRK